MEVLVSSEFCDFMYNTWESLFGHEDHRVQSLNAALGLIILEGKNCVRASFRFSVPDIEHIFYN